MADNKNKLYVKRYKTLKEHRAAVAARKALKGGKNKGPVANADAYGETIKPKKKATPAPKKKPAPTKKPTPTKKPATRKPTKAQTERFYSSSSKGSVNREQAKSNFFAGGKGGKFDKKTKEVSVKNRRGRTVGTKTVEVKDKPQKKRRRYNRRGRAI